MKAGRKTRNDRQPAAELKKRMLAYLIDLILEITVLGGFLLNVGLYFIQDPQNPQGSFQMLCFLITFLLLFLYIPYRHKGQTAGKLVMHIKVISDTGSDVSLWKSCLREGIMKLFFAMLMIPVNLFFELYYLVRSRSCLKILPQDALLHTRVVDALS